MLANSYLLVALNLVTYSCRLVALGAYRHYLARIDRSFCLYKTALFALSSGLNVLCYEVSAFNDNLLFLGRYFKYLALRGFIFAGHEIIMGMRMDSS